MKELVRRQKARVFSSQLSFKQWFPHLCLLALVLVMGISCTLYQSKDREYLEGQGGQFVVLSSGLQVQLLSECSPEALATAPIPPGQNWSQFAERPLGLQDQLLTWGLVDGSHLLILTAHKNTGQGCLAQFDLDGPGDLDLAVEDFLFLSSEKIVGL